MAQGFRFSARPLVAAALLTLTAAPLAAQYGAPPRPPAMPDAPRQGPEAPATPAVTAAPLSEVHRAAACLIGGEDAALAPALLATAPSSPAERDQAIRTIRRAERCLGPRTRIATSALMLRGAIAETLYETNFAQPQAPHNPVTTMAAWFNPAEATARPDAAAMASSYALA
ncbi:MAG: hypothetical protein ACXWU2_14565, partial [Allosphingosinicella sp.]